MKIFRFFPIVFLIVFLSSCNKDLEVTNTYYSEEENAILSKYLKLPEVPYDYKLNYPNYIISSVSTNIDYNKATLGRVLFYDLNLSSDRSVSCASCHKQELAFSDNVALSAGAEGKVTGRNSLALGSVINFRLYYGTEVGNGIPFFWDNSAMTIQEQSERTLANPNEMNMHISEVVERVNNLEYYKPLINKAFNTKSATSQNVLDAIAEFTNSITNYDTKFDKAIDATNRAYTGDEYLNSLTSEENEGKSIYMAKCASCHGVAAGRPGKTEGNNGLYANYTDMGIAKKQGGFARFKIPTLRNIMLTAPYMHDGSLATLDDVLEHYSSNIQPYAGLDDQLRKSNSPVKMNFTASQKKALKAFLVTMTDETVTKDVRFSDPFIR